MKQLNPILIRLMPFLLVAFAILVFVLAIFLFSYVFIAAIIIGLVVVIVRWVRARFFGYQKKTPEQQFRESFFIFQTNLNESENTEAKKPIEKGRIIEHDE